MNKIVYVIMGAMILSGCGKSDDPVAPPPRPALVQQVGMSDANKNLVLVGEIKPRYESNQSFRISGKIVERKAEIGTLVKRGQLLARLDAVDTQLSVDAANADVHAAEAGYELSKAEVERQRKLVEKQFISASSLDKYEADLKTAAARVAQAKARAASSGNQSRYTALVADRDGVITYIQAEPGQVVQAGEVVAKVADTHATEVLISVPESRMGAIKIGDQAMIRLWADREKAYQGVVREIAPAANSATRTFDVRVSLQNADENARLGMTAGVVFAKQTQESMIVPVTALTQINGKPSVWVVDANGVANPRAVTAGAYTENGVPIISGLKPGEWVAIAGVHQLVKGQHVRPVVGEAS